MSTFNFLLLKRLAIGFLFVTSAISANGSDPAFVSLVRNPNAYHHKRVELVGVVRGNSPPLFLFADGRSAVRSGPMVRGVVLEFQKPKNRTIYNLHRVKASGVVDATQRGFWGNYVCAVRVDKIELLSRYPVITSPQKIAVFLNATSQAVSIQITSEHVEQGSAFPAHTADALPVANGCTITVKASNGAIMFRDMIGGLNRRAPYYDLNSQSFFYRITEKRLERAPASEGTRWALAAELHGE